MKEISTEARNRCDSTTQEEQRIHDRRPTNLAVQVYWQDPAGGLQNEPGLIRDISRSGFGLEFGQPLNTGQALSVQTGVGALQCVVRHARIEGTKYFVGLEIMAASDGRNHERSLRNLRLILGKADASL